MVPIPKEQTSPPYENCTQMLQDSPPRINYGKDRVVVGQVSVQKEIALAF
jgi:hypothetical protein